MSKAKKATDPSAPKKTTRTKKPVASANASETVEVSATTTGSEAVERPLAMAASQSVSTMSLEEQVRQRAYEIYQRRGGTGGTAEEDWLQAETEILGRRTA